MYDASTSVRLILNTHQPSVCTKYPGTAKVFLGSYDRDPWSEQRCAHRRSDTILSDGGTNEKDG